MRGRWIGFLAALLLAGCGCGGGGGREPAPAPSPAVSEPGLPGERVRFEALDGVELEGRLSGGGDTAVVLAHMGSRGDDQGDWAPLAQALAADGRTVLTYDRRGVCADELDTCSDGDDDLRASWKDVAGAERFLRERGARRVIVGGASIGAMASTWAAARIKADGLIAVAGVTRGSGYRFTRAALRRVAGRKLFVSSTGDGFDGAAHMRRWHAWARGPKRLVLLDSSLHGTEMLWEGEPTRPELIRHVRRFVREVASG